MATELGKGLENEVQLELFSLVKVGQWEPDKMRQGAEHAARSGCSGRNPAENLVVMAEQGHFLEPVFSNAFLQAQRIYHAPSLHGSLPFPALLIVLYYKFPAVMKLSAVDGACIASAQCFLNSVSQWRFHVRCRFFSVPLKFWLL